MNCKAIWDEHGTKERLKPYDDELRLCVREQEEDLKEGSLTMLNKYLLTVTKLCFNELK